MRRKNPTPIRLTRRRALALVAAAEQGITGWRITIEYLVTHQPSDPSAMAEARALDAKRAAAIDAITIVRQRFIQSPARQIEQVELFEEGDE